MDIDTHPNPTPNPHHRKIDLQSPADLLYLQRNLSAAATQKLNLHFPPKHAYATHIPLDGASSSQPTTEEPQADPMRARVDALVSAFLHDTWTGAKHSISVNGLDASGIPDHFTAASSPSAAEASSKTEIEGVDFTYEAYDPRLSTKVASLYAELEALTSSVSNLRRTNPRQGAEAYTAALGEAMERDRQVDEARREEAQARRDEEVLTIQPIPGGVPEMYESGLAGLAGLSGMKAGEGEQKQRQASLTETVGKVQRARRVVGELE